MSSTLRHVSYGLPEEYRAVLIHVSVCHCFAMKLIYKQYHC